MHPSIDISVIVPAYRAERFIAETLATVAGQTVLPKEVVIVDDGSPDATCAAVEQFAKTHPQLSVRLIREAHRGPGATRNTGVREAGSEWIAFLDSDDLWYPEKLAAIVQMIQANPNANFFCHNEKVRNLDGTEHVTDYGAGFYFERPVPRQLYRRNFFSTSAVVCKRDLVLRYGGFDEILSSAQDYELWLKMSPSLVPVFVPDVLGIYVLRSGNISTRRYWKRLLNILSVKHRHREKGGPRLYLLQMSRSAVSHLLHPCRTTLRGLLKKK